MISERLRKRLRADLPTAQVTIRVPAAMLEDLKAVAGVMGFGGHTALIRAYIGQGLREDLTFLGALLPEETARSTAPMSALSVCAPFDSKRRSKPDRCAPGHGECSSTDTATRN